MKELADKISLWLKDYTLKANRKALVVGVSGGVDSALVSMLCAMTHLPTHCVILPCWSRAEELSRAFTHIRWLNAQFPNVTSEYLNLTDTFNAFRDECRGKFDNELADANAKSRLRMIALYQIATCVDGLVVGTGNKVEDYGIGFFTKYGDGGVDISPIGDLTKTEVRQMCRTLGVLPELAEAVPTDGLWDDHRTDEQAIGATYEELEWAMQWLDGIKDCSSTVAVEGLTPRQKEVLTIYQARNAATQHKLITPPVFKKK